MRVLTFTTLFPSVVRPRHGIFVETRLQHLLRHADVDARVVAPVPWFPSANARFGGYAQFARTPPREERDGVEVLHPRYLMIPGAGMYVQPFSLALGAAPTLRGLVRSGFDFDVLDAHYLYPDGVAAALLARQFRRPLVLTARGSDVNLLTRLALPRRMILWAARAATAIVTVSAALKQGLVALGVEPDRITVLRNGVDTELFHPTPASQARRTLGVGDGKLVLSVGNLVPEKGHDLAIDAVSRLPGVQLLIIGDGPERSRLAKQARELGVEDRVSLRPPTKQQELVAAYSAADTLLLCSTREGWPNVLLESMACGAPVVAADVGGVREVVTDPTAGRVVADRSGAAFAAALHGLWESGIDRAATRRYAQRFGWAETASGLAGLLGRAVEGAVSSTLPRESSDHA